MGPIEYVEFAYDEHEIRENFALVIFKYESSVEDSMKIFSDTKLYGLPLKMQNYSESHENPVFHEELDYFKQLVNVEMDQSNDFKRQKCNDQNYNDKKNIPDSLPEPPMHSKHNFNSNRDNSNRKLSSMLKLNHRDDSFQYQHNNSKNQSPTYRSRQNSDDKHYNRGYYRKSDYNNSSDFVEMSNNDRNSYQNHSYDRKHHDYNWKDTTYQNKESTFNNEYNSIKDTVPVQDLRDTMVHKRNPLNFNHHTDTNANASCTSSVDLRDTMYHRKNSGYEDTKQYKSDSFNERSEKNHKNTHGHNSFSDTESRKNNYHSDRYNETNNKYQNHYQGQEYYDQSSNRNKTYDNFQEYNNDYSNNYNEGYKQEKNRSTNNDKFNPVHSQNMESSSRARNSFHPYTRNNRGYERKNYKKFYGDRSGYRDRSYNRGGNDRSRQNNYYS